MKEYTLYECAVGAKKDMGNIVRPENYEENTGMVKISTDVIGDLGKEVTIRTIDSIIEDWRSKFNSDNQVVLMKIDVEGMELDVLKGATNTIINDKPHLIIEAVTKNKFDEVNEYLIKMNYRLLTSWGITPVYHFAYNPNLRLRLKANTLKYKNDIKNKIKNRLRKVKKFIKSFKPK